MPSSLSWSRPSSSVCRCHNTYILIICLRVLNFIIIRQQDHSGIPEIAVTKLFYLIIFRVVPIPVAAPIFVVHQTLRKIAAVFADIGAIAARPTWYVFRSLSSAQPRDRVLEGSKRLRRLVEE